MVAEVTPANEPETNRRPGVFLSQRIEPMDERSTSISLLAIGAQNSFPLFVSREIDGSRRNNTSKIRRIAAIPTSETLRLIGFFQKLKTIAITKFGRPN